MTKRRCRIVVSAIVLAAVCGGLFTALKIRRDRWKLEQARNRAETEALMRAHTDYAPPRDYADWEKQYGSRKSETHATGVGGDARRMTFGDACDGFSKLLHELPLVYEAPGESPEVDCLRKAEALLAPFGRGECAAMLSQIKWGTCGQEFEAVLLRRRGVNCSTVVERYYRISCGLADMLWAKAGLETEAADADKSIYASLAFRGRLAKKMRWQGVCEAIEGCRADWRKTRCDSETSNLCRAHAYWERRYKLYYEARVKRGETNWLKALATHYPFYLDCARSFLKRDPKWAPKENCANR